MPGKENEAADLVDGDGSSGSDSEEESHLVPVDFVGRYPNEDDKGGISRFLVEYAFTKKGHLNRLLELSRFTQVNLDELAEEIANCNRIGSVFKLHGCSAESNVETEEGFEAYPQEFLFGVVSAIELTRSKPSLAQLVDFLIGKCGSSKASASVKESFIGILKSCDKLRFLVNERVETIPPKVGALALDSLSNELVNVDFDNIVAVTKLVQTTANDRSRSNVEEGAAGAAEQTYLFAEEQQFVLHSKLSFDYEYDWDEDQADAVDKEEVKAFNRVVIMEKAEFVAAVSEIFQLYYTE